MPLYDFQCDTCGKKDIDVYDSSLETAHGCSVCGDRMRRLLPIPNIRPDLQPYVDENMGHDPIYVSSRRQHKEELKKRGLVQIG